jgi:integrase
VTWQRGAPMIGDVMTGIRRRHGTTPVQKAPIGDEDLAALVGTLGEGKVGLRDRAVLTLGWMGAFRRSELVALRVDDVTHTRDGLVVRVRRSKSDQEGRGAEKGIPYASRPSMCPVRALADWLEAAEIASGPLFRAVDRFGRVRDAALSDRSVARIVQRAAAARSDDRRRALAPGGLRDDGRAEGEGARRDHAADATPLGARRADVHPAWRGVRGQRGCGARVTSGRAPLDEGDRS